MSEITHMQYLLDNLQVRRFPKQKKAFAEYVSRFTDKVHVEKGMNKNIIVGDIEKAKVIFTAHYDTCAWMPFPNFIAPMCKWFFPVQILTTMIIVVFVMGLIAYTAFLVTKNIDSALNISKIFIFAVLFLMLFGPSNKHTANDNTSGAAALLMLMERLGDDVAYVFFDNEEIGLLGSAAFASKYKKIVKDKIIINMDCISDGDNIMLLCSKKLKKSDDYGKIIDAITGFESDKNLLTPKSAFYPSDQANFKKTIAVCALNKHPVFGYSIGKIHTHHDTVADEENLNVITELMYCISRRVNNER